MNQEKLKILGDASQYDLCNYVSLNLENFSSSKIPGIYNAKSANGCEIPLFKVLMSNHCANDCFYCINNCKNKFNRLEYSADELISVFNHYYQNHFAEGLFLSSGMPQDPDKAMDKLIEVARKLRLEHEYQGYIHLKILPGASYDHIKRSMALADRVSINIESATSAAFSELTSTKDYKKDILRRMKWIKRLKGKNDQLAPSGQSTQLIVGATQETDADILKRVQWIDKHLDINLSYLSAFEPIKGTPLQEEEPPDPRRVPRLYQSQFLVNSYNFSPDELLFNSEGNLLIEDDPKFLWAKAHPENFPVEINEANFSELIRVPGIGIKSAKRIIKARRDGFKFRKREELKNMGVVIKRAEGFIKIDRCYQSTLV